MAEQIHPESFEPQYSLDKLTQQRKKVEDLLTLSPKGFLNEARTTLAKLFGVKPMGLEMEKIMDRIYPIIEDKSLQVNADGSFLESTKDRIRGAIFGDIISAAPERTGAEKTDSTEAAFLEQIYQSQDTAAMGIYLDWLEDKGDLVRENLIKPIKEKFPDMPNDILTLWVFHWRNDKEGKALKTLLAGKNISESELRERLKNVKLGTGLKTPEDFIEALEDQSRNPHGIISNIARDMITRESRDPDSPDFAGSIAQQETLEELVVVTVAELGFAQGATLDDIYKKAGELGLALCSPEVGPQLRLQYQNQPRGEFLIIGMEPLAASGGDLRLFLVAHGGSDLWLNTNYDDPSYVWDSLYRFVFVLPRK